MIDMLASYAAEPHGTPVQPRHERWIVCATRISDALPELGDGQMALLFAGDVWDLGLHYPLSDMTAFLSGLAKGCAYSAPDDPDLAASRTYDRLMERTGELGMMLRGDLDHGEPGSSEWSRDPAVVADAMALLSECMSSFAAAAEGTMDERAILSEKREMAAWSAHYLWAAYHARQAGIGYDELSEFVGCFSDEWATAIYALVRDETLMPGVLDAISGVPGEESLVLTKAPALVQAYCGLCPTPDGSLRDYLVNALTAVNAMDA